MSQKWHTYHMDMLVYVYDIDALDSRTFFFRGSKLGFLAAMLLEGGAIQLFQLFFHILLVGGFNPFEKYESNWVIISSSSGENQKYLMSCHQLVD